MPHQATFTNRSLFEKYGLFNIEYKCSMDYDLLLRCLPEIKPNNWLVLKTEA